MPEAQAQNYKNHAKFVPAFHFIAAPILGLNLVWTLWVAIRVHSFGSIVSFLVAIALILTLFLARIFPLTVQDRVIRLEMQLRLQRLLPADLQASIPALTVNQLVSLRFASDAELPGLVRKVLADKIIDRKAIKQMIQNWQPDNLRV
ncbi:MAG TPA: DUF6526 family protein [Candidatus Acidoferrales bacterium]